MAEDDEPLEDEPEVQEEDEEEQEEAPDEPEEEEPSEAPEGFCTYCGHWHNPIGCDLFECDCRYNPIYVEDEDQPPPGPILVPPDGSEMVEWHPADLWR